MDYEYRVTKYDPSLRDRKGAFRGDDWTSIGDIGRCFGGHALTVGNYLRAENAYIESVVQFLSESHISELTIGGLENHDAYPCSTMEIIEGAACDLLQIAELVKLNLRSILWCRLESESAFVHFGYDYYMYIGLPRKCASAIEFARRSGLYVEAYRSPHKNRE